MTRFCNLDFETGSEVDIKKVGAHRYAKHPTTHVLCAYYSLDGGVTRHAWRPWAGEAMPGDMRDALVDPSCLIRAWNAEFERLILAHVLGHVIDPRRFRCTMARARSMALPGKLENVAMALQLPVRKSDNKMMLKWCKPDKHGEWATDPAEFEELCEYCGVDVQVESLASDIVRDFSPEEDEDYAINSEVNDNGILIDRALAVAAQRYAREEVADIAAELARLTGGAVTTPRQFDKIKAFVLPRLPEDLRPVPNAEGKLSFDKRAREQVLDTFDDMERLGELGVLSDDVRAELYAAIRVIEHVDDAGRASTAKFVAMTERASPEDDRVRGSYILNGAGQTNRFSAQGLQTQNMIRASLPDPERVIEGILHGATRAQLVALARDDAHPEKPDLNVLTILSRCLRPAIIAAPDKKLIWGDWSAIEARVAPWLSGHITAQPLLGAFERGEDIYIRQACATFQCTPEAVDSDRRQMGKISVLSFGYGGGVRAIMSMARAYGIDIDPMKAEFLKRAFRVSNPWATSFWQALENAMVNAMRYPETPFTAGRVQYMNTLGALWCVLPSGRVLCYPHAQLEQVETRFGEQEQVTAMKASLNPKRGANYWPRMKIWGGFACENVTQAEAASLLRYALRELRNRAASREAFDVIGHSHDEIIREVPETLAEDAADELKQIMASRPAWARDLPLSAEVGQGFSYSK